MALDNDLLLEFLRKMILTRKLETRHRQILARFKQGKGPFICFAHPSRGEEAVGIGATAALRADDLMIGTHRGFVEYLGKGMGPLDIFAEYLGRKGLLDGRAGIQVSDREHGIPAMTGGIGGGYGVAVGIALALKLRGDDRIVMLCYGDGGYNQSDAHPAMVIASSLKLPVLFHVRYNGWAEYTPSCEFNPTHSVAARGVAYKIASDSVDGQQIEVVHEAARKAVEYVRSGQGPFIMEYRTYRFGPHWSSDTCYPFYVDKGEDRELRLHDPIKLCKDLLVEREALSEAGFKEMSAAVGAEVDAIVAEALSLPPADEADMYTAVTAGNISYGSVTAGGIAPGRSVAGGGDHA
jgi:TPP-dependent pyruvate/acetoin dehydrogenase alpha subunit